jgi:hypothetical protein
MTKTDITSLFMRVAERLGVPVAVMAALGMAGWYFGNRMLDEVAIPMTKRHLEFVDEVAETNRAVAKTAERNAVNQTQIAKSLEKFSGLLEEYHGQHGEFKTHVVEEKE